MDSGYQEEIGLMATHENHMKLGWRNLTGKYLNLRITNPKFIN